MINPRCWRSQAARRKSRCRHPMQRARLGRGRACAESWACPASYRTCGQQLEQPSCRCAAASTWQTCQRPACREGEFIEVALLWSMERLCEAIWFPHRCVHHLEADLHEGCAPRHPAIAAQLPHVVHVRDPCREMRKPVLSTAVHGTHQRTGGI